MPRFFPCAAVALLTLGPSVLPAGAAVRIKDVATLAGMREN